MFNAQGSFRDEVGFNNEGLEIYEDDEELGMTQLSIRESAREAERPMIQEEERRRRNLNSHKKDREKRNKQPVLDFKGNIYHYRDTVQQPPITNLNKMSLLQLSYDNKLYLFHDRMVNKLLVYELRNNGEMPAAANYVSAGSAAVAPGSDCWEFTFLYELNLSGSSMFEHLYSQSIDAVKHFVDNPNLIKLTNKGEVKLCYCESFNVLDQDSEGDEERSTSIKVQLRGAIFRQDGDSNTSTCQGFNQVLDFPQIASQNLANIVQDLIKKIERRITNIRTQQSRWPEQLHDYNEYDDLLADISNLEKRDTRIIGAKVYFEDLVVVFQGNFLKYGWLLENKKNSRKNKEA